MINVYVKLCFYLVVNFIPPKNRFQAPANTLVSKKQFWAGAGYFAIRFTMGFTHSYSSLIPLGSFLQTSPFSGAAGQGGPGTKNQYTTEA